MQAGDKIGRFLILKKIGEGGMGTVYQAEDPLLGRIVAIKTIKLDPENPNDSSTEQSNFLREANACGRLSHPSIVTIFDIGIEDGLPFLVMEFIEGEVLSPRIKEKYFPRTNELISFLEKIAYGIDYSHENDLVHRDLKPGNILITKNGDPKILDFGIARQNNHLPSTYNIVGTPHYNSPENINGESITTKSDIFSFGVIVYELITNFRPFTGISPGNLIYNIINSQPPYLEHIKDTDFNPNSFMLIFEKVLNKNPSLRYNTALEFVNDIKLLLTGMFACDPIPDHINPTTKNQNPREERTQKYPAPDFLSTPTNTSRDSKTIPTINSESHNSTSSDLYKPGSIPISPESHTPNNTELYDPISISANAESYNPNNTELYNPENILIYTETDNPVSPDSDNNHSLNIPTPQSTSKPLVNANVSKKWPFALTAVNIILALTIGIIQFKSKPSQPERKQAQKHETKTHEKSKTESAPPPTLTPQSSIRPSSMEQPDAPPIQPPNAQSETVNPNTAPAPTPLPNKQEQLAKPNKQKKQRNTAPPPPKTDDSITPNKNSIDNTAQTVPPQSQNLPPQQPVTEPIKAPERESLSSQTPQEEAPKRIPAQPNWAPPIKQDSTGWFFENNSLKFYWHEGGNIPVDGIGFFLAPAGFWIKEEQFQHLKLKGITKPYGAESLGMDDYGVYSKYVSKSGAEQVFRLILPGIFNQGSPDEEEGRQLDETQHQVVMPELFWLADSEVTQELWESAMSFNPSTFKGKKHPVETVDWNQVQAFLNSLGNLISGMNPRLPIESEWEYACRAGTSTRFYWGDHILTSHVNFSGKAYAGAQPQGIIRNETIPVKDLKPNQWGLFHMHGNVWEWCGDQWTAYAEGTIIAAYIPPSVDGRTIRGGSWDDFPTNVRSASRVWKKADDKHSYCGFRIARNFLP